MSEIRPYRPANGSEGDCFTSHFCDRCIHDRAARQGDYANGCEIYLRSMAFDINDPEYPTEWVTIDGEPTCTAFMEDGGDEPEPPQPDPDPRQLVLIADPTEAAARKASIREAPRGEDVLAASRARLSEYVAGIEADAQRWQALVTSPRVSVLGGARYHQPGWLLAVEFYDEAPDGIAKAESVQRLIEYAEFRAARRIADPEATP